MCKQIDEPKSAQDFTKVASLQNDLVAHFIFC